MIKYNPPQIEKMLSSMTILIDTREQDTKSFKTRCEGFSCPSRRLKLDYGDYACEYLSSCENSFKTLPSAVVERKSGILELCGNFTSGRERFKREFERAKGANCRIHLLIEDDNYEKILSHRYNSKLSPQSLIASLISWGIRYDCRIHFCKKETTGRLIKEILWYELREHLINMEK